MRRRDRFAGIAWLSGFPGEQQTGKWALSQAGRTEDVGQKLEELSKCGYQIEYEHDGSVQTFRLLPIQNRMGVTLPKIGLSYTGTCLEDIVATAHHEVALLLGAQHPYTPTAQEVQRWVP